MLRQTNEKNTRWQLMLSSAVMKELRLVIEHWYLRWAYALLCSLLNLSLSVHVSRIVIFVRITEFSNDLHLPCTSFYHETEVSNLIFYWPLS